MVIAYSKCLDQRGKVASPGLIASVWISSTAKMSVFLFLFAPNSLVLLDGFGSPVPRQPALSPYSG